MLRGQSRASLNTLTTLEPKDYMVEALHMRLNLVRTGLDYDNELYKQVNNLPCGALLKMCE